MQIRIRLIASEYLRYILLVKWRLLSFAILSLAWLVIPTAIWGQPSLSGPARLSAGTMQDREAMYQAVLENNLPAMAQLLKGNTNLVNGNWLGRLPLHVAAAQGHLDALVLLLRFGANIDAEGDGPATSNSRMTALEMAVRHGQSNVFVKLLEMGANPNHANPFGVSALHLAVQNWSGAQNSITEPMAGTLLDRGANPFIQNLRGWTAVDTVIIEGDGKLVARMLELAGASEFLARRGPTLVIEAIRRGQVEALESLIQHKVPAKGGCAIIRAVL